MAEDLHEVLDLAMGQLFRLRGVLDPGEVAEGLGMSLSETMALRRLRRGPTSQQALGSYLGLEKSTVSRLVDAMVRKGWVDKATDAANRRHRLLQLTATGQDAAATVGAAVQRRHRGMLAALTGEERRALSVALPALVRVLSEQVNVDEADDGQPR
jgi:DNA-binding MarR family transcriptional regulator